MLTIGDSSRFPVELPAIAFIFGLLLLLSVPALYATPARISNEQVVTKSNSRAETILAKLADRNRPAYIDELGTRGVNYELDHEGKPFIWCEWFDSRLGAPGRRVACYAEGKSDRLGCMAVQVYSPLLDAESSPVNATVAFTKTCWTQSDEIMNRECTENGCLMEFQRDPPSPIFCCCRTNMCNSNITYKAMFPTAAAPTPPPTDVGGSESSTNGSDSATSTKRTDASHLWDLLCTGLIIFLIVCVVLAASLLYYSLRTKLHRNAKFDLARRFRPTPPLLAERENEAQEDMPGMASFQFKGNKVNARDVDVLEEVAKGRFGTVYKARLGDAELLAAKSLHPLHTYDSWLNEREVYSLDAVRVHPNIAEFVAAYHYEKQFWLITVFYANGSLHDYLKRHTLSLEEAGRISSSMINGLAFLHEEIPADDRGSAGGVTEMKPTIAHRDFKSKNVLVKDDLTACIADFGLALKCDDRRISENETHGQIGTRRYMAPELLEGATDFTSFAFQQIDVYAAALVLWEILSRTRVSDSDDENLPDFELPYEAEAGSSPALGRIREVVVTNKHRPTIPPRLLTNENTALMVKTMTEMWDAEPDGRITSGCARDRLLRIHAAIDKDASGHQLRMPANGDIAH